MLETREAALDAPDTDSTLRLRLRLFGTMEARTADGANVLPIGRKSRALLAILGVSAPHPVPRGRLAYLLWSRRPPEYARASLRQELHRLLAALQPAGPGVLSITRENLSLESKLVWIDVEEFSRAAVQDSEALDLLGGELLSEFDSIDPALDRWLINERKRLRDRAKVVAEALLDEQAEPERIILAAQRLLGIDSSHEGAWSALMRGYAVRGESRKAIQTYDECREVLVERMRAPPSQDARTLREEIRAPSPTSAAAIQAPEPRHAGARWGARVGVMPLQNLSGGDEEAQVSASLMEAITTALLKFRGLVLQSSLGMPSGDHGAGPGRSTFRPEFMLQGSVQRISERLRISLRLIDVQDDECVAWMNRWERDIGQVLSFQDEVAGAAAAEIDAEVSRARTGRLAQGGVSEDPVCDLVTRALTLIARLRKDDAHQAGNLLARVRELQPDNSSGHLWSAYLILICAAQGWTERSPLVGAVAADYAERAVNLDRQDARALCIAGHVHAFLDRRPREALIFHDRALALNPNLALAWELSATAHVYLGQFDEAARQFNRCKHLLPTGVDGLFCEPGLIAAALLQHDFDAAVTIGQRATQIQPGFADGLKPYLAALGHSRRVEQSRTVLSQLLAIEPSFSVAKFLQTAPFEREMDRVLYAKGLRLAGAPETSPGIG